MEPAERLRALFESHQGAVRRYAHYRAIAGADADDLVAEVFAVAWRRLADVPADDALPWLLAVAGNVRRNQARSARRYRAALVALPHPTPHRRPASRTATPPPYGGRWRTCRPTTRRSCASSPGTASRPARSPRRSGARTAPSAPGSTAPGAAWPPVSPPPSPRRTTVNTPADLDTPVADDPLLRRLRDARPETPADLLDPHAPANQALLRSILVPPRHRRRLPRAAAVAAVAAAAAGIIAVWPFGATEPSAADVVRLAVAASESALDSGRAEVHVTTNGVEDTYDYRFAGDDVGVTVTLGSPLAQPVTGERRIVGGELYWHVGDDPTAPWFHQTGVQPVTSDWTGDPRSLLAALAPRAGFEFAGDDMIDGAEVRHLRATTPGDVDVSGLRLGEATSIGGTPTDLDIWVDRDDVVRRIDLGVTLTFEVGYGDVTGDIPLDGPVQVGPMQTRSETQVSDISVRFSDIGVPNAIERPANVRDVSVEEMTHPGPPAG